MGSPRDVNDDKKLRAIIKELNSSYIELSSRLAKSQFPREGVLPDAEWKFCRPIEISDSNPLIHEYSSISTEDAAMHAAISDFKHSSAFIASLDLASTASNNIVGISSKTIAEHTKTIAEHNSPSNQVGQTQIDEPSPLLLRDKHNWLETLCDYDDDTLANGVSWLETQESSCEQQQVLIHETGGQEMEWLEPSTQTESTDGLDKEESTMIENPRNCSSGCISNDSGTVHLIGPSVVMANEQQQEPNRDCRDANGLKVILSAAELLQDNNCIDANETLDEMAQIEVIHNSQQYNIFDFAFGLQTQPQTEESQDKFLLDLSHTINSHQLETQSSVDLPINILIPPLHILSTTSATTVTTNSSAVAMNDVLQCNSVTTAFEKVTATSRSDIALAKQERVSIASTLAERSSSSKPLIKSVVNYLRSVASLPSNTVYTAAVAAVNNGEDMSLHAASAVNAVILGKRSINSSPLSCLYPPLTPGNQHISAAGECENQNITYEKLSCYKRNVVSSKPNEQQLTLKEYLDILNNPFIH